MQSFKYVIIVTFLCSQSLISQTCCSGGVPLSNNIGLDILEKGLLQLGLNYDYNHLNTLKNGNEVIDDQSRLRITHTVLTSLGYSFTDRLAVEFLFTYINQRRQISQFGNKNLDETHGFGDGVFLLKYKFPNVLGSYSDVAIGIGAKMPIGSSTEKNDQGITYNADLQPGSNTWDQIYWSSLSKSFDFRPSLNFMSRFIYRATGTNKSYLGNSIYKFGNEFQCFLSATDQFEAIGTLWFPTLEFKYRHVIKDQINDLNLENTGGKWISVIPTIGINLTPTIRFSSRLQIPLIAKVDGIQLTPTFRFTSGLLFQFATRKKLLPTLLN